MKLLSVVSWMAAILAASSLAVVMPAFAQTNVDVNVGVQGGMRDGANGGMQREGMTPGVFGSVTAISGTTLTVTSEARQMPRKDSTSGRVTASTTIVYTVDASNAKIYKDSTTTTTSISSIAVGDTVTVQGAVSGTSVVATTIRDGVARGQGNMVQGSDRRFDGANSTASGTPSRTAEMTIKGNGEPVVGGDVTAVSGTTVTITNTSNVTYTIDAASTTIMKNGTSTTIGSIVVGDTLVVQGTVNGTSVTATSIIDQGTKPTNGSSTNVSSTKHNDGGFMGGAFGGFFGAIGGFFQHLFGF